MRNSSIFRNRPKSASLLLAAVALAPACAYAVDPSRAMSQYIHDSWGPEQGFPRGPVYAITQTSDGYLWIGTETGLVRFDGLTFRLIADDPAAIRNVVGLMADKEDNLWVRLPGPALLRYRRGAFEDAMAKLGMPYSNVTVLSHTNQGDLLVGRAEEGMVTHRLGKFELRTNATPLARSPVISAAQTSNGDLWLGTRDAGLFRVKGAQVSAIAKGLPDTKINCLLADGNSLWVGTDSGIALWNGSEMISAGMPAAANRFQALAITKDRDGNIWIGTDSRGLLRLNSRGNASLDENTRSADAAVTAVFEDREGNLWFGSAGRLERLRDSAFVTYSLAEGLPTDGSNPVFVDSDSRTWFPPVGGGLWWMKDGKQGKIADAGLNRDVIYSIAGDEGGLWLGRRRGGLTQVTSQNRSFASRTFTEADGLAQNSIYSVYKARDGSIWSGTLSAGVSRLHQGKFTTYTAADGLASNTVASILEDATGTMWFATPSGLSSLTAGQWRTYAAADGLPSSNVNCLWEDSQGVVWVGTAAGLAFREGTGFRAPRPVPAALHEAVLGIAEDRYGSLWIATSNHVLRARRDRLLKGPLADGDIREYGIADGLRDVQGVKRHRSVVADSLGRIWFSMSYGVSMVDPSRLASGSAPALALVQSVSADGSALNAMGGAMEIPAGTKRIALGYTGLSLSIPERVRFRYRLEAFDSDWSAPGAAREAVYTNLAPGSYRFRVVASNPDGAWNGPESGLEFEVLPAVWQTWPFRIGILFAAVAASLLFYRHRVQSVAKQINLGFEERLAERTRIAQELHDTLLQGFLSASMQLHVAADLLPEDSPGKPRLNRVLQLMSQVIDEGRNALRGLRTSDRTMEDLAQAFSHVAEEFANGAEIGFRVIVDGEPRPLHPVLRDEVYRIGREALANAFRHSQARNIEIELQYSPRQFRFLVRDNGRGIDPGVLESGREGHWGLPGMRERTERIGGQLHVWSRATAGTEVAFSVPASIAYADHVSNGVPRWMKRLYTKEHPAPETKVGGHR